MKSEPDVFSIDDLAKKGVAGWDGVRNYQARNFMRAMRKGDLAFFYHSNATPPAIVGLMEIVREAYPDPTNQHPTQAWDQVDVRFLEKFSRPLSLPDVRATAALSSMFLIKRSRLSIQPVTPTEWECVLKRVRA